jgi:hypothetical protein
MRRLPLSKRLSILAALLFLVLPFLATCASGTATQPTNTPPQVSQATQTSSPTPSLEPTIEPTTTPSPVPPKPTSDAVVTGALKTPRLEFGIVSHLYYTDRERVMQLTQNADFDWVRQQVVWKDTEGPAGHFSWDELDPIVEVVNKYNRKLLISIVQSPSFYTDDGSHGLPADPASLGNFVELIANRYGNQIAAYEIWNEQNLAHETGGHIELSDAGHYVEILAECYKRIKAVTPEAYVLVGAPSSSGVTNPSIAIADQDYYHAMYSYKDGMIKDYFDVQAAHPGAAANPPETLWPENPSTAEGWNDHETFYFRHIENVRKIMEEYGLGDRQIWLTEFGWATENVTPGYEYGNNVSFEQQAEYIAGAIELSYENYPWLGVMFLWNMNFSVLWGQTDPPQPLHEQAAFSILNQDWSPRPSYLAVQSLIDRIKRDQGVK